MTSPQDRVTDAVRKGQDTVNATMRTMTDGVQWLASTVDLKATVPTLEELVDSSYAFGVQVLAMQRDFTKSLLSYATPLTETLSSALNTAPRQAEHAAMKAEHTVAEKAGQAAAKVEDVAGKAEKTATQAEKTAAKAERSTRSRAAAAKNSNA